jgi:hypothetical protein
VHGICTQINQEDLKLARDERANTRALMDKEFKPKYGSSGSAYELWGAPLDIRIKLDDALEMCQGGANIKATRRILLSERGFLPELMHIVKRKMKECILQRMFVHDIDGNPISKETASSIPDTFVKQMEYAGGTADVEVLICTLERHWNELSYNGPLLASIKPFKFELLDRYRKPCLESGLKVMSLRTLSEPEGKESAERYQRDYIEGKQICDAQFGSV